jgi:hypothetical protein
MSDKISKERTKELFELGLKYNGSDFIHELGGVFVNHIDLITYDEEEWSKTISGIKSLIKKRKENIEKESDDTINTQIEDLANELSNLADQKADLEKSLEETKKLIARKENSLIDVLYQEGVEIGSKMVFKNGKTLHIKEYFSANIPSNTSINKTKDLEKREELLERKQGCLQWLNDNNLGDIIKNEIKISFDKGEFEKSKKIVENLEEEGLSFVEDENVHSGTLKSALKEQSGKGVDVPEDLFKISIGMKLVMK